MAGTTGTSWSDIPLDLAGRILRLLPAHVDRVRFAAVCPQWRAATWHGPLPPPLPLLLLSDGTVYSLPGSKPFQFAGATGTGYADACGNWLVFSGEEGCSLRDPFSNATVTLPPLSCVRARLVGTDGGPVWSQATSSAPATMKCKPWFCSPNFIVAAIKFKFTGGKCFAVCRAGATSWWSVCLEYHCPDFIDMAFHQGKLYALDIDDSLYEVSMDQSSGDPWISQMRKVINGPCLDIPDFLRGRKRAYLVESHGVLLVVLRQLHHPFIDLNALFEVDPAECNQVKVFQADLSRSRWIEVTMIGNNVVLFLCRRCSRSVCVFHNALPGDCIFFLDNDDKDCRWYGPSSSCSVYSITDAKVSNPLPTVSWKRGIAFGTWLFPQN